jgi:hypothetical protein
MAKPKAKGGMKVAGSKEFRLTQKSQIPLSRAARRAILAYQKQKRDGFQY